MVGEGTGWFTLSLSLSLVMSWVFWLWFFRFRNKYGVCGCYMGLVSMGGVGNEGSGDNEELNNVESGNSPISVFPGKAMPRVPSKYVVRVWGKRETTVYTAIKSLLNMLNTYLIDFDHDLQTYREGNDLIIVIRLYDVVDKML